MIRRDSRPARRPTVAPLTNQEAQAVIANVRVLVLLDWVPPRCSSHPSFLVFPCVSCSQTTSYAQPYTPQETFGIQLKDDKHWTEQVFQRHHANVVGNLNNPRRPRRFWLPFGNQEEYITFGLLHRGKLSHVRYQKELFQIVDDTFVPCSTSPS